MKLDLTGIHIEITDGIKVFVEKKIQKLEKFFDDSTICHVTLSAKKDKQNVNLRIEYKSKTYLAEEDSIDIYTCMDNLISKIEGQLRKTKAMEEKKRRENVSSPETTTEE